jgi:precorrin-6B methylase 2
MKTQLSQSTAGSFPGGRIAWSLTVALGLVVLAWFPAAAQNAKQATAPTEEKEKPKLDVIFVPTPHEVVKVMLEVAEVKPTDILYDLGCGDGRVVVTAASKHGCRALGVDLDPQRISESRENVKKSKVGHLVTIRRADIFQTDLSEASVITLYLLPKLNVRLLPKLEKLKPGTRIVSHSFDIRGVKPKRVVKVPIEGKGERTVYLYVTPLEKESATDSVPAKNGATSNGNKKS